MAEPLMLCYPCSERANGKGTDMPADELCWGSWWEDAQGFVIDQDDEDWDDREKVGRLVDCESASA